MVGFISEPTLQDAYHASKPKNSKDPPEPCDLRANDLSFADSFLDFENWFEEITNPEMAETGRVEAEMVEEEYIGEKTSGEGQILNGSEPIVNGSDPIDCGSGCVVKVECHMSENLSCSIAEEMEKVSLLGGHEGSSVIDGGNARRSEMLSGDFVEREPEINENGSESSESKIEGENHEKSEIVSGNGAKSKPGNDESESESSESESESSESESESSSSSSSSSSDEDNDDGDDTDVEEEGKGGMEVAVEVEEELDEAGEVEEGEIRDADGGEMVDKTNDKDNESGGDEDEDDDDGDDEDVEVSWTDADILDDGDEEEDDVGAIKGPIRSKNELEVLPPIPPVHVTLQPHHQMLPVGVVLSIVGTKVIVEGVEKHNPLNEGTILWITESRSPLGMVDEIFGPVIHPYYVVRYNSESEIPAGIHGGTMISFVQEFADHVLNKKDLYRKGYDASGANDEEVSDEAEFSDDEKEAEHKRMQKMTKRGMNDQNLGNRKNHRKVVKSKMGPWKNGQPSPQPPMGASQLPPNQHHRHFSPEPWKNGQPSPQQTPMGASQLPPNQHHRHFSPVVPMHDRGYCSSSSAVRQGLVSGTGLTSPFPAAIQTTGINATPNGVWTNGMPFQPQSTPFPNGFPNNTLPWVSPYQHQYPYQMPIPDRLPFYQQAGTGQLNAFAGPMYSQGLVGQHGFNQTPFGIGLQGQPTPGGQLNAFAGPVHSQGMVGQHGFNQTTFGIGLQGQPTHSTLNAAQVIRPNGLHVEQNCNMPQPVAIAGNVDAPQQFNQGASSGRGRRPYRRGGRGGRGWQQSR